MDLGEAAESALVVTINLRQFKVSAAEGGGGGSSKHSHRRPSTNQVDPRTQFREKLRQRVAVLRFKRSLQRREEETRGKQT